MITSADSSTKASTPWLASLFLCCAPRPRKQKQVTEKYERGTPSTFYNHPHLLSQLTTTREASSAGSSRDGKAMRNKPSKKHFKSDVSRRPLISTPSGFKHLNTGAFEFPPVETDSVTSIRGHSAPVPCLASEPRRPTFRPLQLSIYMDDDEHLSPILPHFAIVNHFPIPPPAYMPRKSYEDPQLLHQRSSTSLPFHLPRRQLIEGRQVDEMNSSPLQATPVRTRANTSPEMDTLKERVAGAMLEMEKLQKQIDDVIERQSVYAMSRPTTPRVSTSGTPMPSIPALPPSAPSFAERLNSEGDGSSMTRIEASVPLVSPNGDQNKSSTPLDDHSLHSPVSAGSSFCPPPLPLVLRPPLRKKKSFSRVSKWLSDGKEHFREISLDSVTNLPRPIKMKEGFYQCIVPGQSNASLRHGQDTSASIVSWDIDGQKTAPASWSPETSSLSKENGVILEQHGSFGKANARPNLSLTTGAGVAV